MFGHYLTIGWRNIRRSPLYALINVSSLAIGVAASLLIFLYVQYELTYDRFHRDADRIQLVQSELRPDLREAGTGHRKLWASPVSLAAALNGEIPGADEVVRTITWGNATVEVGNSYFAEPIYWADSNFFVFFSFPLVSGQQSSVLSDPASAVLSRSEARRLFGEENPIGQTFKVTRTGRTTEHRVTGVLGDIPGNSMLQPQVVLSIASFGLDGGWDRDWINTGCNTFVRLPESVDRGAYVEQLNRWIDARDSEELRIANFSSAMRLLVTPFVQIHLDSAYPSRARLVLLVALALAILVISSINFVTLAMARSIGRAREICVRKVFGAARGQVVSQFLGESIILALLAVFCGLILAEIALPAFNGLFARRLALDILSNWLLVPVIALLLLLLAFGAGSIPALVFARLQPSAVLQKQVELKRRGLLTHALVIVQLAASLVLLIWTAGVVAQLQYIQNKPLGFTQDHVVVVTNHATTDVAQHLTGSELAARLRMELASDPAIRHISAVAGSFNKGFSMNLTFRWNDLEMKSDVYVADEEFLPALQLVLTQGRNFSTEIPSDRSQAVIVNESFVKAAGLSTPVGTRLPLSGSPVIIGVVRDFHAMPLQFAVNPAMIEISTAEEKRQFLIKVAGDDYSAVMSRIESAWNKVTGGSRFEYSFLEDDIAAPYFGEKVFLKIVACASGIALTVALMGLFGLAGLRAVHRMKEVTIRKVVGASVPQVLRLLNREFLLLVGIANLIAWPVAWYLLDHWLQSYAYRISIDVWPFLLVGVLTGAVALAAVTAHTLRAATVNPTDILRHE